MPCAAGTSFNPTIGVCDHSYNVPGCAKAAAPEQDCALEWSQWYNTHHPRPFQTSGDYEHVSYIEKSYGKICPKPGQQITDVRCECANSDDVWSSTGDVMTCSKDVGLTCHNSDQTSGYACLDYKIRFLCSGGCDSSAPEDDAPSCQGPNGEPLSTLPMEKPGDCEHFYQCAAGNLYVMPCAPGTAFNPAILVCDWPQNVNGC
uniref:chitinase n=1 Tax=Phallusia mammillata TaxID=59560 RepID=A0A6F9DIT8_9ASCI|nr:uncharacterized protein LOC100185438 [Phallusia mammillata]